MDNETKEELNTITAIKNSLEKDGYVFRWFANLVLVHQVKERLKNVDGMFDLYRKLKRHFLGKKLSFLFFLLFCLFFTATGQFIYIITGLLTLYLYILHRRKARKIIIQISSALLSDDFKNESIPVGSLYQLTEYYSLRYGVSSLVGVLDALDNISLIILFCGVFLIRIISPVEIPTIYRFLLIALMFAVAYFLVNLSFFYKKLK